LQRNSANLYRGTPDLHCVSAFFADTRFSAEFNSVPFALMRFLKGILAYDETAYQNARGDVSHIRREEQAAFCDDAAFIFDQLENLMWDVADKLKNGGGAKTKYRLLICLGGVDRLADSFGHFRNGVHRRLFRLLTGVNEDGTSIECKGTKASECWPFDFILLSSHNYIPPNLRSILKPGDEPFSWHTVMPIPLDDRVWLMQDGYETAFERIQEVFQPNIEEFPLGKMMRGNVAIDFWCRNYVRHAVDLQESSPALPNRVDINRRLRQINNQCVRGGETGAVSALLHAFHDLMMLKASQGGPDSRTAKHWRLQQIVLRHLAFFPIPVERSVLASCPEVEDALFDLAGADQETEKKRSEYLQTHALDNLLDLGLVVKCAPSGNPGYRVVGARYTSHELIREHLGAEMGYPKTG
ncbi:MAG: hypothetical protein RIC82_04955, partial [Parvibaculum sp.]